MGNTCIPVADYVKFKNKIKFKIFKKKNKCRLITLQYCIGFAIHRHENAFFFFWVRCLTKFISTWFLTILPPKFFQLASIITSLQIIFKCLHQFNLYFSNSNNESWPLLHTENGMRRRSGRSEVSEILLVPCCLTVDSTFLPKGLKLWFIEFSIFHGVNTSTITDVRWPARRYWRQSWEETLTMHSCEPVWAVSSIHELMTVKNKNPNK